MKNNIKFLTKKNFSSAFFNKNLVFLSRRSFGGPPPKYVAPDPNQHAASFIKNPYHKNHYNHNYLLHHDHHEEIREFKFDPYKYSEVLNQQERIEREQGVPLYDDDINKQTSMYSALSEEAKILDKDPVISEVMVPYDSRVENVLASMLDESEIKARIYNLLRQFDFMDVKTFSFTEDYEKQGLDSLDWTALLTSIEYEFHTVFNDSFYEHWRTVQEAVDHLKQDQFIW